MAWAKVKYIFYILKNGKQKDLPVVEDQTEI